MNFVKRIFMLLKRLIKGGAHRFSSILRSLRNKISNKSKVNNEFYSNIDKLIKDIPISNGSRYYNKINLKVGIITDEYMFNYYKDAVILKYISYSNYKEVVNQVDMVLFVSCWHGMANNDWRGMTSETGKSKVIEVFDYAKRLHKKVIFQTIEDPSNYYTFLDIAKHADYIFTTALEKIEDYKKDTGNKNVFLLDYGINPTFHNPVGFMSKKFVNDVFFAGSWAPRYFERCHDAKILFDGVIKSTKNLIIADRNYYIKGYEFPNKYYPYIIPSIEHDKLQQVHKLFNWSLNLNSIKYSSTMCAMRVYELQAIGNLIISNYSVAVNNIFPNIFIVKTPFDVSSILNSYNNIDIYIMQVDGIRNVMSNHTVYDKLNYIFDCIDEKKFKLNDKNVLVVCNKLNDNIKRIYDLQTYKNKSIIELKDLNSIIATDYDFIAFVKEDVNYQKYYLEDMVNAFKYTDSDFVTIASEINNDSILGINHDYLDSCHDLSLCVFDSKKYNAIEVIKNNYLKGSGYSIDPFSITSLKYYERPLLSVVVPVYNNGKYLLGKCFNSLLRSSLFSKMEIIIVDDGSTDNDTLDIIKDIKCRYSNVKTYFYNGKGSGSASRPRNMGTNLATAKYITYLDPDNEAINDGYKKLYDIISTNDYDFVYGSIIKLGEKETTLSYFSTNKVIDNPKEELINKNFKTNSVQACVIKKDLIDKYKIMNPVGAAGQDSFFFQELMLNSKKAYYLNEPIHIYYAARSNSVVNSINSNFFEKFLVMEKYQVEKLKSYNLLDLYKEKRFNSFLEKWYYEKLKYVTDKEEYKKSLKIINEIKELYYEEDKKI